MRTCDGAQVLARYKQSVSMVEARPSPPAKLAPRAAVGSRVDCHECDLCASWREGSFTTLDRTGYALDAQINLDYIPAFLIRLVAITAKGVADDPRRCGRKVA